MQCFPCCRFRPCRHPCTSGFESSHLARMFWSIVPIRTIRSIPRIGTGLRSSWWTGPTVLHRLVGDGKLPQVVSDHLWLHLNLCEDFAVVDANNGSSHLGHNNHVPEVGLDHVGLLVGGSLLLLLPQLLDEGHGLPLESPGELPPDPADEELHQLLVVHVKELVEVDSPVGELPEGPPLLQLDIGVSHGCFCKALKKCYQAV